MNDELKVLGLAKSVQLGIGVDALGSKMSLRGGKLEITHIGVLATSLKVNQGGRQVLIPWANIRGIEILPQGAASMPEPLPPIPQLNVARTPGRPKKIA